MKPNFARLKQHQEVWALVEERLSHEELIINYGGDLIRVQNQTGLVLRTGQRVKLQVQSTSPLEMRLLTKATRENFSSRVLDINI